MGVAQEDLGKIFERFYQVGSSTGKDAGGSGLGLSIVMNILRFHGCTIHAESRQGEGSAFTFTLPLAEMIDGTEEHPAKEETGPVRKPEERDTTPSAKADREGDRPKLRIIRRQ